MCREKLAGLGHLSDAELAARLKSLAAREREAMVPLVAHLVELDTRDLHLREGYGSLFAYCREQLGLSAHDAYHRIAAARAARRFPVVLQMLKEGSVSLTAVKLLAPHLTDDNHREVLASARGRSRAEVEELVARLWPWPDAPPLVRQVSAPGLAGRLPRSTPGATATPLSPERYKVELTISGETLGKLRLARDMLRHAIPSGDDAAVLERALGTLLEELARKKFAASERPRPAQATRAGSRHLPAEVKRAVWLRDLGRCGFVAASGRRCAERAFLEFHHVKPFAAGGAASLENIQLRCRRHNDYEARLYFRPEQRGDGGGKTTPR
jgi:hypothetical protein